MDRRGNRKTLGGRKCLDPKWFVLKPGLHVAISLDDMRQFWQHDKFHWHKISVAGY